MGETLPRCAIVLQALIRQTRDDLLSLRTALLQDGGFQLVFDPVKVKFKPTAKDMQIAEESGTDLAQAMLKSQRREQRQATSTPKSGQPCQAYIASRLRS